MPKPQAFHGQCDSQCFIWVDCIWLARVNGTVFAPSGADVPKDHQGCGLVVPAFPDVGTPSFFTDGVERIFFGEAFYLDIMTSWIELYPEP